MILPVADVIEASHARGVDVLVDGAHAPGMLPLDVAALGAAYYTGNCHKWLCAPKGAGFLYVRQDMRTQVRPTAISHGAGFRAGPRFHQEFDWLGTMDPTPWLSIGIALETVAGLHPDGWEGIRAHNHALVVEGRALLCERLGMKPPCPTSLLGCLATLPMPPEPGPAAARGLFQSEDQRWLRAHHQVEVPLFGWPHHPQRWVRMSAHYYNTLDDYVALAEGLSQVMARAVAS